jgi:nucleotide-binding universal stress UspA family protein
MIRSILVPLDGSAFAEQALPWAIALALRFHSTLHLVTVHHPPPPYLPEEDPYGTVADADQQGREEETAYLDQRLFAIAESSDLTVGIALPEGDPATEIARYVARDGIDLLVMTTHGRRGLARLELGSLASRLGLGSVASRLLHRLEGSVLLLRPDDERASAPAAVFEHVLVALDGSRRSEEALTLARELVTGGGGGTLDLLMVAESPVLFAPPPPPHLGAQGSLNLQRRMLQGHRYLRRLAAADGAAGRNVGTHVAVADDPAREIVSFAETHEVDLIVLGSRGRGGLGRWTRGSVADKVGRLSRVPVLIRHTHYAGTEASPDFLDALEEAGAEDLATT